MLPVCITARAGDQLGLADEGRAVDDRDCPAVIGHRDRVREGSVGSVGVRSALMSQVTPLGVPILVIWRRSRFQSGEPSPQSMMVEPPPVVKSATVAPWLLSVKLPRKTVPVGLPSMPADLVAGGADQLGIQDGDAAARRAGERGGRAANGGDDDAERVGQARGVSSA